MTLRHEYPTQHKECCKFNQIFPPRPPGHSGSETRGTTPWRHAKQLRVPSPTKSLDYNRKVSSGHGLLFQLLNHPRGCIHRRFVRFTSFTFQEPAMKITIKSKTLLAPLALALCATFAPTHSASADPPPNSGKAAVVTVLGDSLAAGNGAGDYYDDNNSSKSYRSRSNWGQLYVNSLRDQGIAASYHNLASSGASRYPRFPRTATSSCSAWETTKEASERLRGTASSGPCRIRTTAGAV